jgi:hypothetical protein
MGFYWTPMRCPKCDQIMLEGVNTWVGSNHGTCVCGYSYCDDADPDANVREFYNARRPTDEDEKKAWWEQWEQSGRESRDAAERLWAVAQTVAHKGELCGSCSYCNQPGAWRLVGTPPRVHSEACDCGFMRVETPDLCFYRFGQWTIEARDGKSKLFMENREVGPEMKIAELAEFLLRVIPAKVLGNNQIGHYHREQTRSAVSRLLEEYAADSDVSQEFAA